MTDQQIQSIIEKLKSGLDLESTNLDFKRKWWDLNTELDEFLKDLCSMANSQGSDSYIVLGLDKNGTVYNAPLPDDEANLQSKHKDKIEPRVNIQLDEVSIEGKTISIITIPHSSNRPHVIKKYKSQENWIPIRFGSTTLTVSKHDLDEMYQERYKSDSSDVAVKLCEEKISWDNYAEYRGWCFRLCLEIDNYNGKAPDFINNVSLIETTGEHWTSNYFMFHGLNIDEEFKIDAHDRKTNIVVYVSDEMPTGLRSSLRERRNMHHIDRDSLKLRISTRGGKNIQIKIKPGWIEGLVG